MPGYVNIADVLKIALMAFVFIKLANYALGKAGLSRFQA